MDPALLSRLERHGIALLSEARAHWLLTRGNLVVLVERTDSGPGSIGSTGVLTDNGLAFLVWRDARAFLVAKGTEQEATPETIDSIRAFSVDVQAALAASED
jgi:hypothetical protein